MEKYKEKVYFIGAGPGDPELITIKGQRMEPKFTTQHLCLWMKL